MTADSKQALDAWKRADADARAAESRLLAAWELYEKQLVNAPDVELLRQVARYRAIANDRLSQAVIELACVQRGTPRDSRADASSF